MINVKYIPTVNKTTSLNEFTSDTHYFPTISLSEITGYTRKYTPKTVEVKTEEVKPEVVQEAQTIEQPVSSTVTTEITPKVTTTSSKERGKATYKGNINVGNMQEVIDRFLDAGMNIRITSGVRVAGAVGKAGNKSHHVRGNAIDITPGEGETWESLRAKIKADPEFKQWMRDHKIGIIDETDPKTMAKTGATGAHWHVGPDQWALRDFESIFAKMGIKIPEYQDVIKREDINSSKLKIKIPNFLKKNG